MGIEDNMNKYALTSNTESEMDEELIWSERVDVGDREFNEWLEKYVKNPEKFIGVGGAAKVFRLDGQCIKIMLNRHRRPDSGKYDLGNSVQKEFNIQSQLNDMVANGVYSPRTVAYYEGEKCTAIVMEELDAVNMQLVLNGKEKLPDGFDMDTFFERLEDYIIKMHERGIIHNDLEPRNIMIDRKTGLPRVIDFGRALLDPEKKDGFESLCDSDYDNLDTAMEKMEAMIDKKL